MTPRRASVFVVCAALLAPALVQTAGAQTAVSSNDNKVALVDGALTIVKNPAPDTATFEARRLRVAVAEAHPGIYLPRELMSSG
jgi:hypothetical protein